MKKNKLYIGCSSYATQSWKTLFYPDDLPKKEWFNYYSKHFNTYEFNGSFYKFPTVENLLAWHDKVPVDFKFSLKVPRIITHIRRLEQCDEEIEEFYRVSQEGLKNKLACILWQLPPSFVRMHGNPELFYSEYTKDEVETLYHEVDTVGFKEIYIYFNNTASTAAITNALQLKDISKKKR